MLQKEPASAGEQVLKTIESLDATIEDAMDELKYLREIQRGLEDIEAGRTVSHEEAAKRMSQWRRAKR